jgi:hypothetical protein
MDDNVQERRVQAIRQHQQQVIEVPPSHTHPGLALQHDQRLAQDKILGLSPEARHPDKGFVGTAVVERE